MADDKQDVQEDVRITDSISDADERELAAIGKKSVLRRNFSPLAILGLACAIMVTWEGMFSVFIFGLMNGGPAGLLYGFLFCWVGWLAVVMTMGELVSIWPTAGGQYHWTYMLAPDGWKEVLSYVVGWQAIIAWQAVTASGVYLTATSLQGLVVNSRPSYAPHGWHGTLLVFALAIMGFVFGTFFSKWFPHVETGILWLHITLFVVVLVVTVVMAPVKSSNADVWTLFLNDGGYESKGLSFFVGLITPVFAFSGADGAVHMSEEIRHASKIVPWALVGSVVINGVAGFAMLIAILYCIGNIEDALNTPTGFPFIYIFTSATGSIAGGTAVSGLVVLMFCFACMTTIPTASRQLWAFARDNAVPHAKTMSFVHPKMKVPVVAIAATGSVTAALSLINIGSATVFNAIVSLTVSGFLGSYIPPFSLFLYARIKNPSAIPHGPWSLGKWGFAVNAVAVAWCVVVMFFSFWPTGVPVTASSMNWSCVLWVSVMGFSILFWFAYGKSVYNGPIIETDLEHAHDTHVQ
ncbi:hypothetical protein NX059_012083 [Plenodomus lindquistii]|nr:hypothetical protein NX059_012083 [Plenodomus lindquistii]